MSWLVIERSRVKPHRPYYQIAKRLLDLSICVALAPFLVPVALILAIIIRLDSPGPAIFVQERIGKDGRPFNFYKFRTMYHNIDRDSHRSFMKAFVNGKVELSAHQTLQVFKPSHEAHVTLVGRILRRTSLDELPQLINVIKGEMSLVGPRPNVVWEVEEYKGWHNERLEVLPGITGLAQVRGRSGILFDEIVQYDIEYLKRRSLKFDLQVLWWTVISVVLGKGAR
ncbi:MAG TPA: sugar transferase [Anaerolineae bacterium]|nr:sugar transferase [Anaerolineae bacterium]HMR62500.1 sugar transferase [Anaerolineae bacterium]